MQERPGPLVVTFAPDAAERAVIAEAIRGAAEIVYLAELAEGERAAALRQAAVLLARHAGKELRAGEPALLAGARLLQFVTAGIDYIPLGDLPPGLPIASNGGGYAEPMAEHALAMALAAAKRLVVEHEKLRRGVFDQFAPNRMLSGGVCGILGLGGIGVATARLMGALGLRIHAINRRGAADAPVDWIGTPDRLDDLLAASDVLVLSLPLTRATERMIGASELGLMKEDAILVNLARGEIVDEAALFAHLQAHPRFTACIDAWWVEPIRHGEFRMDRPFLDLPNVIGSPHNSASAAGWRTVALRRAAENCRRALLGETPLHLVGEEERMR
jgi:phosphoglycerate dehydrogenase-like enzyme